MNQDKVAVSTGEKILLTTVVVLSLLFLYGARDLSQTSGMFPRFTAAVTFIFGGLMLVRDYLPDTVEDVITTQSIDQGQWKPDTLEEMEGDAETVTEEDSDGKQTSEETPFRTEVIGRLVGTETDGTTKLIGTVALSVVYLSVSYLFGMVITTPIFVALYGVWSGLSWKAIAPSVVVTFLFIYFIVEFFHIPLHRGTMETITVPLDAIGYWMGYK